MSETVPYERVRVITAVSAYDGRIKDPGYRQAVRKESAYRLIGYLLEHGCITFEDGPLDTPRMTQDVRATLGVVSPTVVATLGQRVAEHDAATVTSVIDEAIADIRVWGSAYSGDEGMIYKSQAIDSLRDILRKRLAALANDQP